MKNSFILYNSYSEQINLLDDAECGRLFKALFAFNSDGTKPSLSGGAMMAFSFITSQMQRDAEEYEKVCEKRREAGKRGGEAKAANRKSAEAPPEEQKQEANVANANFAKQTLANVADNENENENENVNENDNGNDKDIIESTSYSSSVSPSQKRKIIAAWNSLGSVGIRSIQRIDPDSKRARLLKARISEYGVEKIVEAIENIRRSDFLQGKNRKGWVITFDWFILPSNFPKVLEGNYLNRDSPKEQQSSNPFLDYLREEGENDDY